MIFPCLVGATMEESLQIPTAEKWLDPVANILITNRHAYLPRWLIDRVEDTKRNLVLPSREIT
jgi:hypothetical protein